MVSSNQDILLQQQLPFVLMVSDSVNVGLPSVNWRDKFYLLFCTRNKEFGIPSHSSSDFLFHTLEECCMIIGWVICFIQSFITYLELFYFCHIYLQYKTEDEYP